MPLRRLDVDVLLILALAVVCALLLTSGTTPLISDDFLYVSAAEHLARGDGFLVTRYPPGMALLLTPFVWLGDVFLAVRLLTVCYLLAVVAVAYLLGGRWAAVIAGTMVALSPFLWESAQVVMTDATGATFALLAFALITGDRRRLVVAGVVSGFGVLLRLGNGPVLVAAVLAAPRGERRWVMAGAAPFVVALIGYQWWAYGSPLSSGYAHDLAYWSPSFLLDASGEGEKAAQVNGPRTPLLPPQGELPGLVYWPAALGAFWAYAPPLVGLLGLVPAWQRRRTPQGRFVLITVIGMLALFVTYYYQSVRLVAPAAALLLVHASAWLVRLRPRGASAAPR